MTTSNYYINAILHPLTEFGGVFNTTTISQAKFKHFPCYLVVNLSPHGTPGSHWVELVLNKTSVFYFDSLGRKCYSPKIKKFIHSLGYKEYDYLKKPIQNILSSHCGFFVMSYFLSLALGISTEKYLSRFRDASLSNDKVSKNIVLKYYRKINK